MTNKYTRADYQRDGKFYCRKFSSRTKALQWLDSQGITDYILSRTGDSLL